MARFIHQVVFITGAGSGIGRATALAFAEAGAQVVVAEINEEAGRDTVSQIQQLGRDAQFVSCDVAEPDQINAAVQQAVDKYGRLDIAVNNAGIGGAYGRLTDQSPEDFNRIMAVNVGGVFYGMQAQIRQMLLQQKGTKAEGKEAGANPMESYPVGGRIVNVASIAGIRGMPMGAPYSASKHAVIGLTKTAALEYAKQNIRINAICPAYTHSAMVDGLISAAPAMEDRMRRIIPLGRFGQPEEIAQAILWLCADENTFFTGQALQLDGGMTAG